ncbi:dihydroxyacetone kinase, DhaK subunit [Mycoplasma putrefaciens]|uniref:phosphoenolpyruvate--glycerone phosphotransferase n=1 Tax=Mycoplasma putrefaciens (strain ATCC 15718 / NCTC 10155 / C30 KS-1 / KS-1) TaxID=743965 RepID=A0A7U3ZRZ8_MYCPK|nr:dihydroxyacetone kinase subunit DhaK [Mycoplasma putrefaciens]AEM68450.1 dihydroxyacetone kinase, DhaK subunit [Mycoplasma putrefaciens KS1]SYV94850.1 dihydroxyacetone kinase, DhaK subunit [Mycoplasma putrefaciens]
MKKIINSVENIVEEMLQGLVKTYPDKLKRITGFDVITRSDVPIKNKVALVSGGGSGHEPAHAGYVGKGMLDAAVAGSVFTSPTPDQIYQAIKAVDAKKGVLLIIKNYTGDLLNFEMAQDMARTEGIEVEAVVVNDDVAVENSLYTAGRRGIAGTVFVHKITGAKAELGADLQEVKRVAQKVIDNTKSIGMALSPCIVPAVQKPNFELKDDEIEIGIGIHGEPGTHKQKLVSANEIVEILISKILENIEIKKDDQVAVMINGMGATPEMELYITNNHLNNLLTKKEIKIYKSFVGNFMTSIEMAGFSISLLKLDDELKQLLDQPSDTIALKIIN